MEGERRAHGGGAEGTWWGSGGHMEGERRALSSAWGKELSEPATTVATSPAYVQQVSSPDGVASVANDPTGRAKGSPSVSSGEGDAGTLAR